MKSTFGDKLFKWSNYGFLSLGALSCMIPFIHIFALSLSSGEAASLGKVGLWPVEPNWDAYRKLITGTNVIGAFQNSIVLTIVGTLLNMVFTVLAAYPLSRKSFYCRRMFTMMIVFTMLFTAGLIPSYLLVKWLGLMNTYWAIWLPGLISAYNLLILRTHFEHIPEELEDAARIDGSGEWRMILQIVLPMSLPVIAVLSLLYGVVHWNAFFHVLVYITDPVKFNLPVLVQNVVRGQSLMSEPVQVDPHAYRSLAPESVKSAGIVMMVLPMLVVYPFLQQYFVKGALISSIKS